MEFKQLRSFVEVIHRGGFTQAGKTLHISQSAVSKQVAQLEHSLGTPLLDRIGSQIRLTAAGGLCCNAPKPCCACRTSCSASWMICST
jgi:DNA-binding transcriptional LysR family regulator